MNEEWQMGGGEKEGESFFSRTTPTTFLLFSFLQKKRMGSELPLQNYV